MTEGSDRGLAVREDEEFSGDTSAIGVLEGFAEQEIAPADRSRPLLASDAQIGIWFFENYAGEGPSSYHIPTVVRLRGRLSQPVLEEAVNAVAGQHEILNCGMAESGGEVVLLPRPPRFVRLPAEAIAPEAFDAAVAELAAVPFALREGPLVRWRLFRMTEEDHRLVILQHHIISDGWSVGLLARELFETYLRLAAGDRSPRSAPRLQYADFAAFTRRAAEAEASSEAARYWVESLAGVPALELPTDRPRAAKPSQRGRHYHFRLPADLVAEVRRFAQRRRTTPYAVLFTAHALLLARYSGQADFVVTMPVDGRSRPEVAEMLGCFVNLLPIRCRIDASAGFAANLDRTFDALLDGATFQDAPFHRIVSAFAATEPSREAALAKLFRNLFVFDSINRDLGFEGGGLSAEVTVEADHDVAKAELSFAMQETGDEIAVRVEYAADLFEVETVARMAEHFCRLLAKGIAEPDLPVGKLPILSGEQFREMVVTANRTETAFPADRSLALLFGDAVARFPGKPAYEDDAVSIDYAELDRRANRFAHRLLAAGVAPADRVGILLARGLEAVIAIIAAIKAGGTYVTIDPTYPEERIALMLDDAGIAVVATAAGMTGGTAVTAGRLLLAVEEDTAAGTPDWNRPPVPERPRQPDDTAYICYTSGTTGRPRGVCVPDRAVARLLMETDYLDYRSGLRFAFASNIVFDAQTLEIWAPLLHGGAMIFFPPATMLEVDLLEARLRDFAVDTIWITAPLFHRLAEERPNIFAGMKAVLTGGAVVDPAAVARVLAADHPPQSVMNGYGPTETTTFASTYLLRPGDSIDTSRPLPIGRAIPNTRLYVVDALGEPVPLGVPGELLIGGPGLAHGYLGWSELNREKFVTMTLRHPDLPGEAVTERVYRSGDIVRWRSVGLLEFVRRADRQIKLRGNRVEPAEIEAAILAHPAVTQAIVVVRGSDSEVSLDAYYAGGQAVPAVEELRAYLAERLPSYMIPRRFRLMAAMPLNTSGKIDAPALPPIEGADAEATAEPVWLPSDHPSPAAREVAEIVAEVLACPLPGPDADFFALGGDSIQSIRVAGRARDRGLALTVRDIFDHRTTARIAAALEQRRQPAEGPLDGEASEIALLPIQRWFFDLALPAPDHFNLAILLKAETRLDASRMQRAVAALVAAQEALRSRWQAPAEGGQPTKQQVLAPEEVPPVQLALQRLEEGGDPAEEIRRICTAWQSGFDIQAGPILSAGIIGGHPDGSDRLFLAVHHLAIDVVSLWILVEQLKRFYDGDGAAPAAEAPGSLRRWSQALVEHAGAASTLRELDHWTDAIAGPRHFEAEEVAEPAAQAGAQAGAQDGCRIEIERRLGAPLFDAAAEACQRLLGLRPHEVAIAAATLAVAMESGQRDITVAVEGHGREAALFRGDLSRTLGWFTSLHPCRFRLSSAQGEAALEGEAALLEALADIKDALGRTPGNGIGFGILRYLSADASVAAALSAWSSADLSVNYLGALDLAAGDWQLEDDSPGTTVGPANPALHALDLTAFRSGDEIVLALVADGRRVAPAFAEAFCERVRAVVAAMASLAASKGSRLLTAADHPLSRLDRPALTRLLGEGGEGRKVLSLTSVEEGLLFEALRHPESNAYTIQMHWRHEGELEPPRLRLAFEALIRRHDALRSRFAVADLPHPVRIVEPEGPLEWHLLDWRRLDEGQQAEAWARLLTEDRRRRFDLGVPGGARVVVIRSGPACWQILWTYHHIFVDGWSVGILLADLAIAYDRIAEGRTPYDDVPPPFDAFLAAQPPSPDPLANAFWSKELGDLSSPTDLPFRLPGTQLNTVGPDGASVRLYIPIPAALTRDLKALGIQQAITPSAAFQFAWALVLARCAGSNDVTYGTTASGRTMPVPGIEHMVGLGISTVPVRVVLDEQIEAIDAIRALHAKTVSIQEHAHVSLADLHQLSAVEAGERLFHSLFVFENYPTGNLEVPRGLQFADLEILDKTDAPLTVLVVPGEAPRFEVVFDPTLFARDAVERLCGHILSVLGGIVADPHQRVDQLDILTAAERREILEGWNATAHPLDLERSVLDLFAASVAVHPERTAASHGEDRLSYRALDEASTRLARRLRHRHRVLTGAEMPAETVVALVLERGLPMIVSMLAVMKAGGAYLPIDVDDPAERLAFMVQDAGAPVVLTDARTARRRDLPALFGDRLMVAGLGEEEGDAAVEPLPAVRAGQLGYVIYTSGSTGRPKGTLLEHRGLVNRLAWVQNEYFALTPEDRVLQKTPYTFDVSIWELFWPLVEGAELVFAEPGGHRDPAYLHRVITERAITVVHFVPSMLQVFVEYPGLETLGSLRLVAASGEGLPTRLSAQVLAALPHAQVINLYGPTEATIEVSGHRCTPEDAQAAAIAPIGLPAWNTSLHVLDPAGRLLPVGVPGELHIGGVQLARGYLNQPELTAERFVENAYGLGRLYRTGDLVRRRLDGVIDYLGRIDFQLKVRGMRVEPGEIEAALEGLPGISKACVVAEEQAGGLLLVAYATGDRSVDAEEIRQRLSEELPDHMVPARLVMLDAFPLTTSGKVDRKRLPQMAPSAAAAALAPPAAPPALGDAPLTPGETLVAAVFGDVLRAGGSIDPDQSFFALGGHSLTAMRAAMRLSERFGVEVPVRLLFEHSSVRALADAIGRMTARGDTVGALRRCDRAGALLPSFAQARVLFLEQFAEVPALYTVPAAMRVEGDFDEAAFARAATALIAAHEILRTRYLLESGALTLVVDAVGHLDLETRDIAPDALDEALREEANSGFALDRDPPIRFRILRCGPGDRVLVVTLHHVVTDGWSLDILLADLAERYEAERSGRSSASAAPALSYIDFAAWQRAAMNDRRMQAHADYWRERLAEAPVLELPTDRPRPAIASYRGDTACFALDQEETEALKRFCRDQGSTLFPVLLAAWTLVLSRYSGQDDVIVGTPVASRPLPETEQMVGLFQNSVPLRVRLQDEEMVAAFIARVAEEAAADFAHQDLPFQLMIEALGLDRDPSRPPLFQAMVILDGGDPSRAVFAPEGTSVTPIPLGSDTAKADLTAAFALTAEGLKGTLEYATDLFTPAAMERMGGHLLSVLRTFVADPFQTVGEVNLLTRDERSDLLERFNATAHPVDLSRTVLDDFAATVQASPEATAVVHGGESLSYRELDAATTRLARVLRSRYRAIEGREMPPETVVALVLERGTAMIVSLLAVLKAGGAYLPISPDDPAERVGFMLQDAAAALVVGHSALAGRPAMAACPDERLLYADRPPAEPAGGDLPKVSGSQLAYVLYTSGSTGRPKGTLIEHRSLTNRMAWVQGSFPLSHDDRVLQKTPYTFDVSISELLWPMTVGACLVFADPGEHHDPASLHRLIREQGITVVHFVPSMLQPFVDYPGFETLATLRLFLLIGEPLPSRLSEQVLSALPQATMINLYGPTEATIDVSAQLCSLDDPAAGPVVAIGRPGWNTALHVIDAGRRLVPVGVPGELAIGGVQVARGYLNRPEADAASFLRNPFGGGRLYRTGDLVRRRADGVLEFLGRLDFQVKIRGMRVELGEVEARLEACAGVTKACVLARGREGDTVLVAYVTGEAAPEEDTLKTQLAAALPSHMVPARILRIESFPLTTSGKIDRKRLPDPYAVRAAFTPAAVNATATEETLSDIWRETLGHDGFSAQDRFFDVGGTSLGAMGMVSAIARRLGLSVPVVSVFRYPSIRELAAHLDSLGSAGAAPVPDRLAEARERVQGRRTLRGKRGS